MIVTPLNTVNIYDPNNAVFNLSSKFGNHDPESLIGAFATVIAKNKNSTTASVAQTLKTLRERKNKTTRQPVRYGRNIRNG